MVGSVSIQQLHTTLSMVFLRRRYTVKYCCLCKHRDTQPSYVVREVWVFTSFQFHDLPHKDESKSRGK